MWGELVSTGQPRLELKWYHLNIFHSCLGWPRSGGNIYTYIGVITPDITSSFVTHYFHSREYVKLNNGIGRNILACFNSFFLPLQFLPIVTSFLSQCEWERVRWKSIHCLRCVETNFVNEIHYCLCCVVSWNTLNTHWKNQDGAVICVIMCFI